MIAEAACSTWNRTGGLARFSHTVIASEAKQSPNSSQDVGYAEDQRLLRFARNDGVLGFCSSKITVALILHQVNNCL